MEDAVGADHVSWMEEQCTIPRFQQNQNHHERGTFGSPSVSVSTTIYPVYVDPRLFLGEIGAAEGGSDGLICTRGSTPNKWVVLGTVAGIEKGRRMGHHVVKSDNDNCQEA